MTPNHRRRLEIDSSTDLTPLVDEFAEGVFLMYNGEWGKMTPFAPLFMKRSYLT